MNNTQAPVKKPRCQHISKIGSRCHADPETGKDYCFFHDPDQKKKQAEARKQGGEARFRQTEAELTLPPNLPYVRLEKACDVFDLMAQTVHHLQCSKMDVRVAQAIAYLSSLLLRALKTGQPMIARLLADTINHVRCGETDLRTGRTIGNLASIMLTALKQEALEQPASAEAIRPAEAPRGNSLEAIAAQIAATQSRDDHEHHELHPAAIGAGAAGAAAAATHA